MKIFYGESSGKVNVPASAPIDEALAGTAHMILLRLNGPIFGSQVPHTPIVSQFYFLTVALTRLKLPHFKRWLAISF